MSSAKAGPARVTLNRRSLNRRVLARGLLLLAAAPVLASCSGGLRPLYGPTMSGAGLQNRLSQVDVAPIPGRVGQRIRNELIFHNTGGGHGNSAPPTHRLEVVIRESVQSTLVKIDGEALSQIYAIEASFRLISMKDKKVVLQGASHGRAAFERFESIYSNVRAREDAENRVARTVSDDLKVRLATYLSGAA